MIMFFPILLIQSITVLVAGESTAVVNTTSGPMRGQILKSAVNFIEYAAFTGIRFGKAPIGYLRFKPPVPVDPWTEIFNATSEGNECPQINEFKQQYSGSEDCLFLSVYTPVTNLAKPPTKLKSVMVWIYGGGFRTGSHVDPRYHPDFLLEKDVAVVFINYRLGALGFLSLNHPNATGNAGLKDQRLALQWIQANIEKFGGNPKNITIFGQSAGAISVGYHILSENSAGLFHGAISMSGTPLVPGTFNDPADAENRAVELCSYLAEFRDGTELADKSLLLKTLYEASPQELVMHTAKIKSFIPFSPTSEDPTIATDVFLSECPLSRYISGNYTKVPQILGFMEQELVSYLRHRDIFSQFIDNAIKFSPSEELFYVKDRFERKSEAWPPHDKDFIDLAVDETSIRNFLAPIDSTQQILAAENDDVPVYYYHITFTTSTSLHNLYSNTTIEGAGHSDDLAYVFYSSYANYTDNIDYPEALTLYRVSTMWTNFAKYGNPTQHWIDEYPLSITWPPSGCSGKALNIGYELTLETRPIGSRIQHVRNADQIVLGPWNGCSSGHKLPKCIKNPRKQGQY